jgi:hypothetical protein
MTDTACWEKVSGEPVIDRALLRRIDHVTSGSIAEHILREQEGSSLALPQSTN